MSTRSIVARADADFAETGNFQGRYVHSDGYPNGVGRYLWEAVQGYKEKGEFGVEQLWIARRFKNNLSGLLSFLIDKHQGWSSIYSWTQCVCGKPQLPQGHERTLANYHDYCLCIMGRPQCHCHDPKTGRKYPHHGEEAKWDKDDIRDTDCQWLYVIEEKTGLMHVYELVYRGGHIYRKEKFFRGTVNLFDATQPDWDVIQHGEVETKLFRYYKEKYTPALDHNGREYPEFIATCPNGHDFYQSSQRRPGDKCDGNHWSGEGHGAPTDSPYRRNLCDHIFALPEGE